MENNLFEIWNTQKRKKITKFERKNLKKTKKLNKKIKKKRNEKKRKSSKDKVILKKSLIWWKQKNLNCWIEAHIKKGQSFGILELKLELKLKKAHWSEKKKPNHWK